MVSKESLEKFKMLYQAKYNISLTDEEATQMATDLVNLMQVLLKPDPTESELQKAERRQDENFPQQTS